MKQTIIYLLYVFLMLLVICFIGEAKGEILSKEEMVKICKHYKYHNCNLVAALVAKESSGRIKIKNPENSGSYGLMQIQCDTAKARGLKYNCSQLFGPKCNIRFGIKHLLYIEGKLGYFNVADVVSIYNAGWNCKKWIGKRCIEYTFSPPICKRKKTFRYPGFPSVKCFKGEYTNEEYVREVMRQYIDYIGAIPNSQRYEAEKLIMITNFK